MNSFYKRSANVLWSLRLRRNPISSLVLTSSASFSRRIKKLSEGKGQDTKEKKEVGVDGEEISPEEKEILVKEAKREAEESKIEFQALKEKLFSSQYDKELDKKIIRLIEEGKSNDEIVNEILRNKPKEKKAAPELFEGKKKSDITVFDLLENFLVQDDPNLSKELKENKAKMERESQQNKKIMEILKKSPNSPTISELPIHEKINPRRKMTEKEREEIEMNVGLMQQYGMTPGNKITKDIHKKRFYVDADEAEDDEAKSALEENSKELQKDEGTTNKLPEKTKEEKIKEMKVQYFNSQMQDDTKFKALAEKDSDNSAKDLGIYEPPPKIGDKYERRTKSNLPDSAWTASEKRLAKLEEKYGDVESVISGEFALVEKEFTLAKKKLEEENAEYKKFLEKKRKIQKIKEITREIEEKPYKDDINYRDHTLNQPKQRKKKDPYFFGMPDIDRIDAMNEEEAKLLMKDSDFEVHRLRSLKNLDDFISDHFTQNKRSLETLLKGRNIVITEVSANYALTVIYVSWDLLDESLNPTAKKRIDEKQVKEAEKEMLEVEKRLGKYSKYFGGVICKKLGFKYAPDVRFIKANYSENYEEIVDELNKNIPEVTKQILKEKLEKEGKIPVVKKKDLDDATELNLNTLLGDALKEQSYAEIKKKEKEKKLYDESGKRVRNNRDEEGKKKKYDKKNKPSNFWANLKG